MKLTPLDRVVLVRLDKVSEKIGSVLVPREYLEKQQNAVEVGTLEKIGEHAFDHLSVQPQVGDRVTFPRYAGTVVAQEPDNPGGEKTLYRLMDDEQITAIWEIDDASKEEKDAA